MRTVITQGIHGWVARGLLAGLVLGGVPAAVAAEASAPLTDTIPIELARLLIGNSPDQDLQFHAGLSPGFPAIDLPDDITVLGSMDHGQQIRVILQSPRNAQAMSSAVVAGLTQQGWQLIPRPRPPIQMQQPGFVNSMFLGPSQLCHDALGHMTISPMGQPDSSNSLQLFYSRQMGGGAMNDCQMQIERMSQIDTGPNLMAQLPVLELPADRASAGGTLNTRGSGGGGDYFESRAVLTLAADLDEVLAMFNAQIVGQGWTLDTESSGALAATSVWHKTLEDDATLVGLLYIVAAGDDEFSLLFRLSPRDTNGAGGAVLMGRRIMANPAGARPGFSPTPVVGQ